MKWPESFEEASILWLSSSFWKVTAVTVFSRSNMLSQCDCLNLESPHIERRWGARLVLKPLPLRTFLQDTTWEKGGPGSGLPMFVTWSFSRMFSPVEGGIAFDYRQTFALFFFNRLCALWQWWLLLHQQSIPSQMISLEIFVCRFCSIHISKSFLLLTVQIEKRKIVLFYRWRLRLKF